MSRSTRDRLVDEARRLFASAGFEATSVAQIEQAAGLKPGAGGLYAHFDSKADVLSAAVERSIALAEVGYSFASAMPLGDIRAELILIARGSFALFDAAEDWIRIALKDGDRYPELFADARERLSERAYRFLAEFLKTKIADGVLAHHDAEAVGTILFGAISNYWMHTRVFGWQPINVDQDQLITAWVDLALRLAPPADPDATNGENRRV